MHPGTVPTNRDRDWPMKQRLRKGTYPNVVPLKTVQTNRERIRTALAQSNVELLNIMRDIEMDSRTSLLSLLVSAKPGSKEHSTALEILITIPRVIKEAIVDGEMDPTTIRLLPLPDRGRFLKSILDEDDIVRPYIYLQLIANANYEAPSAAELSKGLNDIVRPYYFSNTELGTLSAAERMKVE